MRTNFIIAALTMISFSCSDKKTDELGGAAGSNKTYFTIAVDGIEKDLNTIHYARQGRNLHLAAFNPDGFPNLNVTLTTSTEDDFRGSYAYDYSLQPGTGIVLYGVGVSDGYESHWWDCPSDAPLLVPSPGSIKIEHKERTNGDEFITGSFSASVFQPQGDCPYTTIKTKTITAKFRLKKAG